MTRSDEARARRTAKAGIHRAAAPVLGKRPAVGAAEKWIPAFAGKADVPTEMTRSDEARARRTPLPAKAGIHLAAAPVLRNVRRSVLPENGSRLSPGKPMSSTAMTRSDD
jgi:hypothetical protein